MLDFSDDVALEYFFIAERVGTGRSTYWNMRIFKRDEDGGNPEYIDSQHWGFRSWGKIWAKRYIKKLVTNKPTRKSRYYWYGAFKQGNKIRFRLRHKE